jgi:hypothetical protein
LTQLTTQQALYVTRKPFTYLRTTAKPKTPKATPMHFSYRFLFNTCGNDAVPIIIASANEINAQGVAFTAECALVIPANPLGTVARSAAEFLTNPNCCSNSPILATLLCSAARSCPARDVFVLAQHLRATRSLICASAALQRLMMLTPGDEACFRMPSPPIVSVVMVQTAGAWT